MCMYEHTHICSSNSSNKQNAWYLRLSGQQYWDYGLLSYDPLQYGKQVWILEELWKRMHCISENCWYLSIQTFGITSQRAVILKQIHIH
jgi:hypothetical protein